MGHPGAVFSLGDVIDVIYLEKGRFFGVFGVFCVIILRVAQTVTDNGQKRSQIIEGGKLPPLASSDNLGNAVCIPWKSLSPYWQRRHPLLTLCGV